MKILQGRTMGEIFREEINIDGILLALKETEFERCVPISSMKSSFLIKQLLTPKWAGRRISKGPIDFMRMMIFFSKMLKDFSEQKNCKETDKIKTMDGFPILANTSVWKQAEISSGNFHANARGCAKLASFMALKGDSLISQTSWEEMHSEPTTAEILKFPSKFLHISIFILYKLVDK